MIPTLCMFNDCTTAAIDGTAKCEFHKNRKQCAAADCFNQVYARGVCVRHGGKRRCQSDGCQATAKGGDFCTVHGGVSSRRLCSVDKCFKQAHARQLCVRHGGGRRCNQPGCRHHARNGRFCQRHSEPDALKDLAVLDYFLNDGCMATNTIAPTVEFTSTWLAGVAPMCTLGDSNVFRL